MFVEHIKSITGKAMDAEEIKRLNPLVLAYIGDTVYDLLVRTFLIMDRDSNVHNLHIRAIGFVSAGAQANTLKGIFDILTEEEKNIIRRGRNTKSQTVPKNANVGEYRYATGFEALLGFLYLKGDNDRLMEIGSLIIEAQNKLVRGEDI